MPFEIYLYLLQEPSFYNQCMPFTTESREEKFIGRNSEVGSVVMDIPMLTCREAFFKLTTYCRLHTHGEIVLIQESLEDNKKLQERIGYHPTPNEKYVPITNKYLVYRYKPSKSGRGKLTATYNPDFGMGFLPMFVKERVIIKMGAELVENMTERCKKFKGSEWEELVKKDPESFVFFKSALHNYREKQRISAQ